jgi:hypothetical protein
MFHCRNCDQPIELVPFERPTNAFGGSLTWKHTAGSFCCQRDDLVTLAHAKAEYLDELEKMIDYERFVITMEAKKVAAS